MLQMLQQYNFPAGGYLPHTRLPHHFQPFCTKYKWPILMKTALEQVDYKHEMDINVVKPVCQLPVTEVVSLPSGYLKTSSKWL